MLNNYWPRRCSFSIAAIICGFLTLGAVAFSARADEPIQIRITAAAFDVFKNNAQNAGISLKTSQSGFDVYWTGYSISSTTGGIYAVSPTLHGLAGSGRSQVDSPSGTVCTGTFSIDPSSQELFYPTIAKSDGSTMTLQIAGPARASNSITDAFLDDRTPGLSSSCQAPIGPSLIGGSGTWTPEAAYLPNDGLSLRSVYALVQFNTNSLPQTLPFTFHYDFSVDTLRSEAVFFGVVTVSKPLSVQAADPFTLGGYAPPAAAGDDLAAPPPPSAISTDTPARIGDWLKSFIGPITKALKNSFLQARHASGASSAATGVGSYDPNALTFTFSDYPTGLPGGATLDFVVVMRPPNNAPAKLKPVVPNSAVQNVLPAAGPVSVVTTLTKKIKSNLKSGKAFTVYVTVRVKPTVGAKVQRTAKFGLPAKRKK